MINYRDAAIKALIEEYRIRFTKVITHYCICKREYDRKAELLGLMNIKDEVKKCIEDKKPCDLGNIKVDIIKRLFRTEVYVLLGDKKLSADEFKKLLITLESFMEWYRNDCSIDAVMLPLVGVDYFEEIKALISDNLDLLNMACDNSTINADALRINQHKLPDYVIRGLINALLNAPRSVKA